MKRSAFTLVELLVVIGVIAVLIAMLLPALSKAKESARAVACLSNMRQVHTEMFMYASQNDDKIPMGYWYDKKYSNQCWMATGSASPLYPAQTQYQYGAWMGIGWLYHGGFMKNPKIYWDSTLLPVENFKGPRTSTLRFDPAYNDPSWGKLIWPPGNWGTTTYPSYSNQTISIGFNTRPISSWSNWDPATARLPRGTVYTFAKLRSQAVLAEGMTSTSLSMLPHNKGMNVMYADGSGMWVSGTHFLANMIVAQSNHNMILTGSYPTATGVWGDLDRAR